MPLPASHSSIYPVEGGGERAHTGNLRRPKTNIHPSQLSSPDSLLWTQETHRASPKIWGEEVLRTYRCPEITSILLWGALSPRPSRRLHPGSRSQAFFCLNILEAPPLSFHSCWVPARWTGRGCLLRFVCALVPGMHLLYVLRGATQWGSLVPLVLQQLGSLPLLP